MSNLSSAPVRVDRVVVGGGAMGLAAAAELTRRNLSVAVLEQFELHHAQGASHGATRNFNNAYPERDYLDLIDEARAGYRALERETGRALLSLSGLVTHGDADIVAAAYTALHEREADVSLITAAEAQARWSGMRFQNDVMVSVEAGVISSAETLLALEDVLRKGGQRVLTSHRVLSLEVEGPERVSVRAVNAAGEFVVIEAAGAVAAVGAWSSTLLGDSVALPPLEVAESHPAHFVIRDDSTQWSSFNHMAGPEDLKTRDGHGYGMLTPGEGMKVGLHTGTSGIDPAARPHRATAEQRSQLREYVGEWLPGLDPDSAVEISCTYTSTPATDFVLDQVGPLTVAAGFSGHGFKFVPAIGRILADASTQVQLPPERFRLATHASGTHSVHE